MYLGPTQGTEPYFESLGFQMPANDNPADWFMDVISGEVTNPKIENFKLSMLFDIWEKRKPFAGEGSGVRGRRFSQADDLACLAQQLNEAWDRVDKDGSATLDEDELEEVLQRCTGVEATVAVVDEMMARMGGEECAAVDKHDFTNFLVGLKNDVVAQDKATERYDESEDEVESATLLNCGSNRSRDMKGSGHKRNAGPKRPGCAQQFRTLSSRTESSRPFVVLRQDAGSCACACCWPSP